MKTQLYHVFRTYWNRPLIVLLGLSMFVLTALLFFQSTQNSNFPVEPEFGKSGNREYAHTDEWEAFLKNENPKRIDSLVLIVKSDAEIPDLSPFTELQSLKVYMARTNPELLKQIQSLKKLTSFTLHCADRKLEYPKDFFKDLGPQLLEMDLSQTTKKRLVDLEQREYLSNLELLKIGGWDLSQETISVISALPNLKTLVIDTSVMLHSPQGALLLPLKKHPTLKRIYAHWFPRDDHWYNEAALSPIQLFPSSYRRGKVTAIQMALFVMGIFSLIVSLQLWSQFVSSGALVIPGYAKAHQRAAVLLLCSVGLVTVIGIVLTGVAILPAITFTLAVPAGMGLATISSQSHSQARKSLGVILGVFLSVAVVGIMSVSNTPWLALYYICFLQGYYSVLAALVLMTELGILAITYRRLPEVTRFINEKFTVPPGVSPWDAKQQQRACLGQNLQWQTKIFDFKPCDVQFHQGSMWKQIKLWRLGSPYRPLSFLFVMGGMIFIVLTAGEVLPLIWENDISFHLSLRPVLGMLAIQMPTMAMLFPVVLWFKRSQELELETMRPVSRKDLVRQLFLSLGIEQSWALVVGIFLILLTMFLPEPKLSRDEIVLYTLFFVAGVFWINAISISIFAIRRAWVILAVGLGTTLALVAVLLGWNYESLSVEMETMEMQQQLAIAKSVCIISIPASIGMIAWMYRKALDREWGS